jgi:formylmethanofuran dehydrogenase subunit B
MPESPVPSAVHRSVACPACGLLCDDLEITVEGDAVRVTAHGCARSELFFSARPDARPLIAGQPVSLQAAFTEAAAILRAARRPLLASAGADVAAMRAMLELAEHTGAVVDHDASDALFRNVLVLQDGGWMSTTLTEVRNRADLLVAVGTDIVTRFPRFFERCFGDGQAMFQAGGREVWFIGPRPRVAIPETLRAHFVEVPAERLGETFAAMRALAAGRPVVAQVIAGVPQERLRELLERMRAARYGVAAWSAADLDFPHAELTIQAVCELVKSLNAKGRFAVLPLGTASHMTAMQVCTWQTGFPLRVSFAGRAPSYDPLTFSARRMLDEAVPDAYLAVSAFEVEPPRTHSAPSIVLGRTEASAASVFIPVASPGIHQAGHLFRTDSVVAVRLRALLASRWPSAAQVLRSILREMKS